MRLERLTERGVLSSIFTGVDSSILCSRPPPTAAQWIGTAGKGMVPDRLHALFVLNPKHYGPRYRDESAEPARPRPTSGDGEFSRRPIPTADGPGFQSRGYYDEAFLVPELLAEIASACSRRCRHGRPRRRVLSEQQALPFVDGVASAIKLRSPGRAWVLKTQKSVPMPPAAAKPISRIVRLLRTAL